MKTLMASSYIDYLGYNFQMTSTRILFRKVDAHEILTTLVRLNDT